MECCNDRISSLAVSSVLSADTKQYGKKFLIDDDDDTCWSSDQGKSQHIAAKFNETTKIAEFHIQFQGGFSCKQIDVQSKELADTISFYPDDVNEIQKFTLPEPVGFSTLRLVCLQPTDFFGRIVVYHVKFFSP